MFAFSLSNSAEHVRLLQGLRTLVPCLIATVVPVHPTLAVPRSGFSGSDCFVLPQDRIDWKAIEFYMSGQGLEVEFFGPAEFGYGSNPGINRQELFSSL